MCLYPLLSSLLCSLDIPWKKLPEYLQRFDKEIMRITGNGYCFIQSVLACMKNEFGEDLDQDEVTEKVLDEMYNHLDYYSQHFVGSKRDLIKDAELFFYNKCYRLQAVDICIPATANALRINMYIFEKSHDATILLKHPSRWEETNRTIYLCYSRTGSHDHTTDHYDAIVDRHVPTCSQGPEENQWRIVSPRKKSKIPTTLHVGSKEEGLQKNDEPDTIVISSGTTTSADEEHQLDLPSNNTNTIPDKSPYDDVLKSEDQVCDDEIPTGNSNLSQSIEEAESNVENLRAAPKKKRKKNMKNSIDMNAFVNIEAELVDRIPWKIDGNKMYSIMCEEDYWHDLQIDGHTWKSTTSSRKDLDGIRKFATCKGGLICQNPECPKLTTEGVENIVEFKRDKQGSYTCSICGYYVTRKQCPAVKVTEFDRSISQLTILHQGYHTCVCKPDLDEKKKFAKENVLSKDLRKSPKELVEDLIGYYLATDQSDKAWEVADKMDNYDLLQKMRYTGKNPFDHPSKETELEAFKNVGKLRDTTSKVDRYLIYKMNSKSISGEPSYIFKSSQKCGELALKLDKSNYNDGQVSDLVNEKIYIDGTHSRCKEYKTLTMWVYHPGMLRVMKLATMEVEKENTQSLTLFLQTFNSMLQDIKKDPEYHFFPTAGFLCDEHGANFNAIENVYGKEMLGKTVTCQWHFRECAKRQVKDIRKDDRETFKEMVSKICYTSTATQYKRVSNTLEKICERNDISSWYKWWQERRYHIVPAYRGFNISGLNMAETGHSAMSGGKNLWLSAAAFKDTVQTIVQDKKYTKFCTNINAKVAGKGPTLLQRKKKERNTERKYIDECCDALESGNISDIEDENNIEGDPAKYFAPNMKAKHRVPEVFSSSNPTQSQRDTRAKKKLRKPDFVYDDDSDTEQEIEDDIVPVNIERRVQRENWPTLVPIFDKVTRCYGCQMLFEDKLRRDPHNLVFKYKLKRKYKNQAGKEVQQKTANPAYFHARDLGCLRCISELEEIELSEIYIDNKTFMSLTSTQIHHLKKINFFQHLKRNRQALKMMKK